MHDSHCASSRNVYPAECRGAVSGKGAAGVPDLHAVVRREAAPCVVPHGVHILLVGEHYPHCAMHSLGMTLHSGNCMVAKSMLWALRSIESALWCMQAAPTAEVGLVCKDVHRHIMAQVRCLWRAAKARPLTTQVHGRVQAAMFFFMTNKLSFRPEFLGRIQLFQGIAELLGVHIGWLR